MDERGYFDWFCKEFFIFLLLFTFFMGMVSAVSEEEKITAVIVPNPGYEEPRFRIFSEEDSKELVEESITHTFDIIDGYAGEFTSEEIEMLKEDPRIIVEEEREFRVLLDSSINTTRVNDTWNLQQGGINLTGLGETVCILDTGVNYTQDAFGNCFGDNNASSNCTVLGGWDFVNNDNDPFDDYAAGHGTHVSGIVASADSTYQGIAFDSKIIHMKVLDNTGVGGTADIVSGINWCVANASIFNISVISMSLGDSGMYDNYCTGGSIEVAVNAAVAAGIPVVVAAGNCDQPGQTSCQEGITYPACLVNSTPVGAVYNNDTIKYMRTGNITDQLFAPGVSIVSTVLGGGFGAKSGTSMATPHVAAAMAILQQFSNLQDGVDLSVSTIRNTLENNGELLDDTAKSEGNFTRINLYSALLSLDSTAPVADTVTPVDGVINVSTSQLFTCNATDWQLENVTLHIWNSTGLYLTNTSNFSGSSNSSSFSISGMPTGSYDWGCFSYDVLGNGNFSVLNSSLVIGGVSSVLSSPLDVNYTRFNLTNYTCNSSSEDTYSLSNVTLFVWNSSSGSLVYNSTFDIDGISNSTSFEYNFTEEGNYTWNCLVVNNVSNSTYADSNYTVLFDNTSPVIGSISRSVTSSGATLTWGNSEEVNATISGDISYTNSSYFTDYSVTFSSLLASTTYSFNLTSCDRSGNCDNTSFSFTTSAAPSGGGGSSSSSGSSGSSSSSGGGGGGTSRVEYINDSILEKRGGLNKVLESGKSFKFSIDEENHTFTVESVGVNSALFKIESDPIELRLFVGEERKVNITSLVAYEFYLRLNSIENDTVNLTVRKIDELINPGEIFDVDANRTLRAIDEDEGSRNIFGEILVILVVAGIIFLIAWHFTHSKILSKNISHGKKLKGEKTFGYHRKDDKGKKATIKALGKR